MVINRVEMEEWIEGAWGRAAVRGKVSGWDRGYPCVYALVRVRPKLKDWASGRRERALLHVLAFSRLVVKPFVDMRVGRGKVGVDFLIRVFQGYERIPKEDIRREIGKTVRRTIKDTSDMPIGLKDAWGIVPVTSKETTIQILKVYVPK